MRMYSKIGFLVFLALAVAAIYLGDYAAENSRISWLGASPVAAHDYDDVQGTEFDWDGVMTSGKTLEIITLNGKIIAKPAKGNKAVVHGVKKARHGGDPEAVRIEIEETSKKVRIRARWPKMDGDHDWDDNQGNVRVDFTIEVPSGVKFKGNTVNGGIEAKNLKGPVHVSTVNGSIKLSSNENVNASTVNGSIKAAVESGNWKEPLELETVNGSIELKVPKNANADFYAETVNGSITSDFPITVSGKIGPKEISGTIGKGGRELRLSTVNGSIKLLASR